MTEQTEQKCMLLALIICCGEIAVDHVLLQFGENPLGCVKCNTYDSGKKHEADKKHYAKKRSSFIQSI